MHDCISQIATSHLNAKPQYFVKKNYTCGASREQRAIHWLVLEEGTSTKQEKPNRV